MSRARRARHVAYHIFELPNRTLLATGTFGTRFAQIARKHRWRRRRRGASRDVEEAAGIRRGIIWTQAGGVRGETDGARASARAAGQGLARTHAANSAVSAAQAAAAAQTHLLCSRFRFGSSTAYWSSSAPWACWQFWAPDRSRYLRLRPPQCTPLGYSRFGAASLL